MSERDELLAILYGPVSGMKPPFAEAPENVRAVLGDLADAVLAAGYRRPNGGES